MMPIENNAARIEANYSRANELRQRGEFEPAESALRAVLRQAPSHRDAAYSLAHMLREEGRLCAASEVIVTLWNNHPEGADAALAALTFLIENGSQDLAQVIASDARSRWPEDARIAARAGELALALGDFDAAATSLREALDRDPQQSAAWLRLAYCRRFNNGDDADVQRFVRGWQDKRLSAHAHICSGFALGKALDDIGNYAQAAGVLRSANTFARAESIWRTVDWRAFVERRLRDKQAATLNTFDKDFVPVFIIGMPRTGTTLISTALRKYPAVRDRGELNWIPALHAHLLAQGQLQNPSALTSIAAVIRAQMRRDDAPARFYVDKNPLNFRYLDFILALFPNAKFIHCQRDVRDTALSIWMQHFAHEDLGFSYAFSDIAEAERGYRALMTRWRHRLSLDVLDVDYENFVTQPDEQQNRLQQFLGVEPTNAERKSSTAEAITTASVWQARQPVYTHALQRWRQYAPYLPELIESFPD